MPKPKQQRKVEYKKNLTRKISFTIEADEQTLDRFATMLLFARTPIDWSEPLVEPDMPWPLGEIGKPDAAELRRIPDPELRVMIAQRLTFLAHHTGIEFAKNMLKEYQVERASQLEGEQLRRFHDDLVQVTSKFKPAETESSA